MHLKTIVNLISPEGLGHDPANLQLYNNRGAKRGEPSGLACEASGLVASPCTIGPMGVMC